MSRPLRLLVYDATCRGRPLLPGLSHAWASGGLLYRALGRLDGCFGAASWDEALGWLGSYRPAEPIGRIEYWGHGKWGRALLDRAGLDVEALDPAHALYARLSAVRDRLAGQESLVWFRTCELFGASAGHDFARRFAQFFGCRVAGHTFIISHWQSGLHSLRPHQEPGWPAEEGLAAGTPSAPERALWSGLRRPHTVSFLGDTIPSGW